MTHHRPFGTIAILGAAALLLNSAPLAAQQTAPAQPPSGATRPTNPPPRRGPATIDDRVARMTADLGLSADQAGKVRTMLTAQQRTQDSILARRAAVQDAERAAMIAMQTNGEKTLAGILTPDQKLKHDAMRARRGGPQGFGRADGNSRGGHRGDRRGRVDGRTRRPMDEHHDRRGDRPGR
jgi:hypothetical protein